MSKQSDPNNPDFINGSDLPNGDGTVGDEQVNAIDDDGTGKKTGQDHSTEHYEDTEPTDGVGAVQDGSIEGADVAHIRE